jgi:hypothetical protein
MKNFGDIKMHGATIKIKNVHSHFRKPVALNNEDRISKYKI